jgi:acyl-coenzyme A synthetase/AMP-(fatty) acid ligase
MYLPMTNYEEVYDRFEWQLPRRFNFGRDVVDALAQREPDKLALLWCDESGAERRFGFGDISCLSNRLANLLVSSGVKRGDRVIVLLPRIPHWQIAMIACLKLGAVPIPCIEMLTEKDVSYRVGHSGAVAAITTRAGVAKFKGAADFQARIAVGSAPGWLEFDEAIDRQSDHFEPADMHIDEPALIYYTSGATGLPKGVTHAVRALYCWRVSAWYWQGLREDDLNWCTADTGWSKAGTSILFGPWSCGTAVLVYDGRFHPAQRLELLERHGVTVFCAAATEFRQLVSQDFSRFDLRRLRLAVSAGESVNPEVVHRWQEITGVPLIEAYGQTETLMTVANHPSTPRKPGSMGRPLPGTRMVVLDESFAALPPNERGQLALQLPNPQLMLGYWQEPERTAATRIVHNGVGYFLTGDLATIDEEGFLFYAGRADDVINSAGYRIGPTEVENALTEHSAVVECAVVGSPDPERGEIVKAFVILRRGYSPSEALVEELQEHVKRVTAPYKYPRRVEFVTELPKTTSGKLLRRVLRDREYARAANRQPV